MPLLSRPFSGFGFVFLQDPTATYLKAYIHCQLRYHHKCEKLLTSILRTCVYLVMRFFVIVGIYLKSCIRHHWVRYFYQPIIMQCLKNHELKILCVCDFALQALCSVAGHCFANLSPEYIFSFAFLP
jgi:hypothetical protein